MSTTMKAIVFTVVLLAAAGVTARSLLVQTGPETVSAAPGGDSAASRPPKAAAPAKAAVAAHPLPAVDEALAHADAVFVLLAGDDDSATRDAAGRIKDALKQIDPADGRAALLTFPKGSDDYASLAKKHSITSFPSVLVVGKACGPDVIPPDDITEARLLGAFLVASDPSLCETGCAPSPDCEP